MKKLITTIILSLIATQAEANLIGLYKVEQSPFATYIAQEVGDILTVIVDENAKTIDGKTVFGFEERGSEMRIAVDSAEGLGDTPLKATDKAAP